MGYELVCVDMFQTLVDVNKRTSYIWKRILGEDYSEKLHCQCVELVSAKVINAFHINVDKNVNFYNLKTVFKPCFEEIFGILKINFSAEEAVSIFLDEHGKAVPYEDTFEFFKLIGGRVPVCLVSDADNEMVEPLLENFQFDKIFISEKVMSYKNEPESRIFKEVLAHYNISPQKVIHIGDASSDIIGANKFGITTCWINRNDIEWKYNVKPDYTIKSLVEVIDIINNNFDNLAI